MLSSLFGQKAAPVIVDINEIYERFDLHNERFKEDHEAHSQALAPFHLLSSVRGPSRYGPGRSFYTNPGKTVTYMIPSNPFETGQNYYEKHVRSSACVIFTLQPLSFNRKRGFALIIRQDSPDIESFSERALVFGIYGVYGRDGKMTVKKLLAPDIDEKTGTMTEVQSIEITENNVRGALLFAEMCAKALYNGDPFFARQKLEQSMEANLEQEGVKVLGPQP